MKLIHVLLNHQLDGLIIAPSEDVKIQINYLQENEIPFVLFDGYIPGTKASYVVIDNYKAAYSLAKHVIDNGSKRIGIITFFRNNQLAITTVSSLSIVHAKSSYYCLSTHNS